MTLVPFGPYPSRRPGSRVKKKQRRPGSARIPPLATDTSSAPPPLAPRNTTPPLRAATPHAPSPHAPPGSCSLPALRPTAVFSPHTHRLPPLPHSRARSLHSRRPPPPRLDERRGCDAPSRAQEAVSKGKNASI
jgi:hypothetical protein